MRSSAEALRQIHTSRGKQEHDSNKPKQKWLSLVKQDRFPEGVPAVGPPVDTKVVGCLRGGKIVKIKKDKKSEFDFPCRSC